LKGTEDFFQPEVRQRRATGEYMHQGVIAGVIMRGFIDNR